MLVPFSLLTEDSDSATKRLTRGAAGMTLEADRRVGETTWRSLVVRRPGSFSYRLLVDPGTKLIWKIELVNALEVVRSQVSKASGTTSAAISWTARSIRTGPPTPDAFAYLPPPSYKKVAPTDVKGRPTYVDPRKMLEACQALAGQPAPDFEVIALDGPGRTRPIRKADLAGVPFAIVVWPAELPSSLRDALISLIELADSYEKAGRKTAILFLTQNPRLREDLTVREQVERSLSSRRIPQPAGRVGSIVLDPMLSVYGAYHVAAFPVIVVVDGLGTVHAVHIGSKKDYRALLSHDLEALLAGQPLPKPETPRVRD